VIERDKRAVLIANNFFKSQLFFNKSYALRSVGTSEGVTCCAGSWQNTLTAWKVSRPTAFLILTL